MIGFDPNAMLCGAPALLDAARHVSPHPAVQRRYVRSRLDGESHNMAEILAARRFPGLKTDAIFMEGWQTGNQFDATPETGAFYRQKAEAAGVSTQGKRYLRGLARFPGDPRAWVSDRHDVLATAEANGMKVEGYVNHNPGEREPMAGVTVGEDIVRRQVARMRAEPGAAPRAAGELREHAIDILTGHGVEHEPRVAADPPPPDYRG